MTNCLVIGIGNEFRRDDGAGVFVARQIGGMNNPLIRISFESGEGVSLMSCFSSADNVIMVDAVSSGAPAGTIHRFDVHEDVIPTGFFNYSTHAFSVAEAIEMARALEQLPAKLILYGIEGEDFSMGEGLSARIKSAALTVIAMIRSEIERLYPVATPGGRSSSTKNA